MGNNEHCRANKKEQVPEKHTTRAWLEMGSLSRKQADKLKYMEYLIKDKQTLYVFLTEEEFFFSRRTAWILF